MANTMPVVPYKIPLVTPQGMVNRAWDAFFRELFTRVNGESALTLEEVTELIETMQDAIDALSVRVAVTEGLTQGRQL